MTNEASEDTRRAIEAARSILDGRDPTVDWPAVLVTLDHAIASVLLVCAKGDVRRAEGLFREATCQHVEERLALFAAKGGVTWPKD